MLKFTETQERLLRYLTHWDSRNGFPSYLRTVWLLYNTSSFSFIGTDQYILYNISSTSNERPLIIDRVANTVSLSSGFLPNILLLDYDISHYESTMSRPTKIYGIIGTIRLLSGRYIMTIDRCELVGSLFGHQIFKVTSASLRPFASSLNHLNATEVGVAFIFIFVYRWKLRQPT